MYEDLKPSPWEIDDCVYYLEATHEGDFPCIRRGWIEEIHRNALRLRPAVHGSTDLCVYVPMSQCFRDVKDLLTMLKYHLNKETTRLEGVVYEW